MTNEHQAKEKQELLNRFTQEARESGKAELLMHGFSPEFRAFLKEQYGSFPAGSKHRIFFEQFLDPIYVADSIQNLEPLLPDVIDANIRDRGMPAAQGTHAALNNFWLRFTGCSSAAEPAFVRLVYSEPELVARISSWAVLYGPCRRAALRDYSPSSPLVELCEAMERKCPLQDLSEAYGKALRLVDRHDLTMCDDQTIGDLCKDYNIACAGSLLTR